MSQIIKVKFLKAGLPQGRAYTYFSNEMVKPGDLVKINEQANGAVTEVNVPEEEIESFKDKVKFIHCKISAEQELKPEETHVEENGGNELCQNKPQ